MSPLLVLDLLGVFFFALSGCLLAVEKRFDVVGSVLLGALVGLGGGVVRDVIIDRVPTAIADPLYLVPPVLAAAVVRLGIVRPGRFHRAILLCDAGGLALFCVSGTVIASSFGLNPFGAALMGATTAAGGGLLRDVVANEVPALVDPAGGLYGVPALVGASVVAGMAAMGWNPDAVVGPREVLVVALVFGFRVAALRYRWRPPLAGPDDVTFDD